MKKIISLAILLSLLTTVSCSKNKLYTESRAQIGTLITLTAVADSAEKANQAFDKCFAEVERIGALMGPRGDGSDIVRINSSPAHSSVEVSDETYALLQRSMELSTISEGGFDITFAGAGRLWNFKEEPLVIPTASAVQKALKNVGYTKLILLADNRVMKSKNEVQIGLGGIAKGYVIKRCVEVLKKEGIHSGIVDAGGDVEVFGTKLGSAWRAGLRHPREKGALLATISLHEGEACATSGDYERMGRDKDGKLYHHIIDPRTGFPTETFASVTVLTDDPVDADSLATTFFVMGLEKTKEYLAENKDIEVVLVDRDLSIYASSSLKERVSFSVALSSIEWL